MSLFCKSIPGKNTQGCPSEILKRGTKFLFCGRGLNCFSSLRGNYSKTTHYLLSYFSRLNTLKRTAKAPALDLFMAVHPWRGTAFLSPKGYNAHPCPVSIEVSPREKYPRKQYCKKNLDMLRIRWLRTLTLCYADRLYYLHLLAGRAPCGPGKIGYAPRCRGMYNLLWFNKHHKWRYKEKLFSVILWFGHFTCT